MNWVEDDSYFRHQQVDLWVRVLYGKVRTVQGPYNTQCEFS